MDFAKLFSFSGRISRRSFWLSTLVLLGFFVMSAVLYAIHELLSILAYIPLIWIGLAISVKRWHDRGKSAAWVLIALIPVIGSVWAFIETGFLAGEPSENTYGLPESGSPFGG